jgi:broad specificity phosphatase PhoE
MLPAFADAAARASKTVMELLETNRAESIVAVSHEIIIRSLIAQAHGLVGSWVWAFEIRPGSIHRLRLIGGRLVPG